MQSFVFSNDFYKTIDLMVHTSGHEQCKPSHSYGPAVRNSYMLHYIHSGKGIYQTGGKTYSLQAGDLFLMIPGERIFYQADEEDPWVYSWIGIQGMKAEEYIRRSCLFQQKVCHLFADSKIPAIFEKLKPLEISKNFDLLYNCCAWEMVYQLAEEFPVARSKEALHASDYINIILNYIEQNYDRPISVQEIADHMALDRSYVHRIFKKAMDMSVKEYILSVRLANACSYLLYSDLPIGDISRSVGYEDVLYFSKLFHKKKGLSPSQYRTEKRIEYQIQSGTHPDQLPEVRHSLFMTRPE